MNVEKRQLEFGETLLRLRVKAGYNTGKDFAEAIGWQASKVSRIENGRTLPALADVEAWSPRLTRQQRAEQIRDACGRSG